MNIKAGAVIANTGKFAEAAGQGRLPLPEIILMKNLFVLINRKNIKNVVIFFIFFLPLLSAAEVFKWVDKDGRTNFTDDYSKIPKEYRTEEKTKDNPIAPKKKNKKSSPITEPEIAEKTDLTKDKSEIEEDKIKFTEDEDSNLLLKVILNDRVMVNLIMDNSDTSSISPAIVSKLGLNINDSGDNAEEMQTIVRLDSLRIGSAEVRDVRVVVASQEHDGTIGGDILDEFSFKIDRKKKEIIFSDKKPGANKKPGGHTQKWWQKEFSYAQGMLAKAKELFDQETDPQKKKSLLETKTAWEAELKEIQSKAFKAGVPLNWQREGSRSQETEENKSRPDDEKWWKKQYGELKNKLKDIDSQIDELNRQKESNPHEFSYQQGDLEIIGLEKQKSENLKKLEELDSDARRMGIPKNWK